MAEIRHLVVIAAPPSKVYAALTEQAGLAGWWTEETVAEPVVGSVAEFKFGERYLALQSIERSKTISAPGSAE